MKFSFNLDKNKILIQERKISFEQIIEIISEKGALLDIKHPNPEKYPNQKMFVVEIDNYTYSIPYVLDGNKYFLKTIYKNRKFLFLLDKE